MFAPDQRPHTRTRARGLVPAVAVLGLLGLLASACGGGEDGDPVDPTGSSPVSSPTGDPGEGDGPGGTDQALYFYPPVEGATLTLANSGALTGTSEVTVESVSSGGDGQTVSASEINSTGGEPVTVERTFLTGPDGGLSLGAEGFTAAAPGMEVTAAGDAVVIPPIAELESGGTATGETFVEFSGAGISGRSDVTYSVTGGGFTSVTVPAGTVDAYVVEVALEVESDLAGIIEGTADYWFVPGFGLVRQETAIAGSTLVSELEDSSVDLP